MLIGAGRIAPDPEFGPDGPSLERFSTMVRLADRYGFAEMSVGDGPGLTDCLVTLAYAATITNRIGLAVSVVNPLTRDPTVMASALLNLHVISGGRACMVLGRGDGAVRLAGLKEASVLQIKEYYLAVRDLLDHGEAVYQGRTVRFYTSSIRRLKEMGKIPLYIITAGPRTLKMAGAIADGIHVAAGLAPEVIKDSLARIREGAIEAGRDPSKIDIWWSTRSSVGRTHQEAVDHAKESLASIGNHSLRGGSLEEKCVPEELRPKVQRYLELYDWREKGLARGNVALMEELGLYEYFLERFAVAGTPEEVVARLKYLQTLGVNKYSISAQDPDMMRLIGEEIIPALA